MERLFATFVLGNLDSVAVLPQDDSVGVNSRREEPYRGDGKGEGSPGGDVGFPAGAVEGVAEDNYAEKPQQRGDGGHFKVEHTPVAGESAEA